MDFNKLNMMQMLQTKMGYLSERQDILSKNIANVDTPGYKARDLKELDFKRMVAVHTTKLKMRLTSPAHGTGFPKLPAEFRDEKTRKTFETTPVKNNVVIEEQMAKVAETNLEYQKITNLYNKTTQIFKTAIGGN